MFSHTVGPLLRRKQWIVNNNCILETESSHLSGDGFGILHNGWMAFAVDFSKHLIHFGSLGSIE